MTLGPRCRAAVGLAAGLALTVSGCSDSSTPIAPPSAVGGANTIGAIPDGQDCGEVVRPRLQLGSHLLPGKTPPIDYSSNPPSSGWHASGAPALGVRREQLTGPQLVSALEVGHVVVAYDPGRVDDGTITELGDLATSLFADRLTVTPWSPMPSEFAFVGWGALQRCHVLDDDQLSAFVLNWFGQAQRHD